MVSLDRWVRGLTMSKVTTQDERLLWDSLLKPQSRQPTLCCYYCCCCASTTLPGRPGPPPTGFDKGWTHSDTGGSQWRWLVRTTQLTMPSAMLVLHEKGNSHTNRLGVQSGVASKVQQLNEVVKKWEKVYLVVFRYKRHPETNLYRLEQHVQNMFMFLIIPWEAYIVFPCFSTGSPMSTWSWMSAGSNVTVFQMCAQEKVSQMSARFKWVPRHRNSFGEIRYFLTWIKKKITWQWE